MVQTLGTPMTGVAEACVDYPCERKGENLAAAVSGSLNLTRAAEEANAENLLVIRDRKLAELYIKNWWGHEGHTEGYTWT